MRIVILTENMANGRGLLAEHGLSVLVEAAGKRILFDTGQSDVYLRNAGELGESLEGLDGIVLSHGHYDHTGGLPAFPEELPAPVFVRENAFEEKLSGSREKGTYRDIGIPWRKEGGEGAFGRGKLLAKGLLRQTGSLEEIFPDVWTVSGIRAVVPEEPVPEQFFLRRGDMLVPDLMEDEQLLVFHTPEGLAVFAGCAHLDPELPGTRKGGIPRKTAVAASGGHAPSRLQQAEAGGFCGRPSPLWFFLDHPAALHRHGSDC